MLQFLLVLLGLVFPNSNTSAATSADNNQTTIITNNSVDGDTGGDTTHKPPTYIGN